MQERFLVFGRAGSGKTHLVLQKFLHYVKEHKEENVILILPTNSQVEHLRDYILRTSALKGYLDTGIVTFSGLAGKVLDTIDNSASLRKSLNENEKYLLLSNILKDINKGYFSEVVDYAGFKRAFLNLVREIKENSLDPSAFKDILKIIRTGKGHTPLNLKCQELATLYERYQQALNKNGLADKEDVLAHAISHLDENTFPGIGMLLIDGFHDYTQLELKFLTKLTSLIQKVYITLPLHTSDPAPPALRASQKTYSRLTSLCIHVHERWQTGLGFRELRLGENKRTPCRMLRHIETNIFSPPGSTVLSGPDHTDSSFRITAAANIQDEVGQIAREIRKLTYVNGYSFSQIAVIFRSVEKYQDIVEDTFARFRIPVRIYGGKPLKDNPLIRAIVNIPEIFTHDWQDEAVWKVLKSNTGIEQSLINRLEYEYLKRGCLNDYRKWLKLISTAELQPVSNFLKNLKNIFDKLEGKHSFNYYCTHYTEVVKLFYKPFFSTFTHTDTVFAEVSSDPEISSLMKSDAGALRELLTILHNPNLLNISKDMGALTFEEFNHIFVTQIALSSYKGADKRKDVVNVINVLEARQWEIPVVFVGGLLEKEFPRQIREDLFLKDYYRQKLNASEKIMLREAREQMDEERYLFYIAITRAKERLYLSYPSANSSGNPTLPSFFLSDIQKLFSKEILKSITIQRNSSEILPEPEDIITLTDAKNFLYYHLNTPCMSKKEEYNPPLALWLYNNTDILREELCALIKLKDYYNNLKLNFSDKRIVKNIHKTSTRFSSTSLKNYAQCPYKYFGSSTLNLRQVIPLSLDSRMQGNIIHKVLEGYFNGTKNIAEIFDDVFRQKTRGMIIGFEELKIRNEMLRTLLTFEDKEKESASSKLKPSLFEVKFGNDEAESLKVCDGKNEMIGISGKIDRIDISELNGGKTGLIIDYKYGKSEFTEKDLKEGLDLQLPIYLLALRDVFRIVPVAAEFYALKTFKKSGIYNQELIDKLNLDIKPLKKSLSVDTKEFNKLLKEAENHILKFAGEIRDGRIELAPANIDLCGEGNCDFANVCRIDKWRLR